MYLLKTKLPGLLPSAICTSALIACDAMESASSTNSFAKVIFCGGLKFYKEIKIKNKMKK